MLNQYFYSNNRTIVKLFYTFSIPEIFIYQNLQDYEGFVILVHFNWQITNFAKSEELIYLEPVFIANHLYYLK